MWTLAMALLVGADERAAKSAPVFRQTQNVVFAETHGVALVMDIFSPTGKKNGLGLVDVISGAFHSDRGKLEDHRRARVFDTFCGDGYTVFAVRPGSVTKFTLPEMLANLQTGIRWVKLHATEYGVDPNRLGLMGASAGGNLCCLAAVRADDGNPKARDPLQRFDSRVKAACAFFPPTDFLQYGLAKLEGTKEVPLPQFLASLFSTKDGKKLSRDETMELLSKHSPARLVTSKAPPFLLVHGTADFMVPIQQSERMKGALEKAGVPVKMIVKPGGGHPWPTIHEEIRLAADWFNEQLAPAGATAGIRP